MCSEYISILPGWREASLPTGYIERKLSKISGQTVGNPPRIASTLDPTGTLDALVKVQSIVGVLCNQYLSMNHPRNATLSRPHESDHLICDDERSLRLTGQMTNGRHAGKNGKMGW
jgi:hypothetical protein